MDDEGVSARVTGDAFIVDERSCVGRTGLLEVGVGVGRESSLKSGAPASGLSVLTVNERFSLGGETLWLLLSLRRCCKEPLRANSFALGSSSSVVSLSPRGESISAGNPVSELIVRGEGGMTPIVTLGFVLCKD